MYNEKKTHSSSCSCLGSLAGWHLDSEDSVQNLVLSQLGVFYHVAWDRKKTEESSTNRDHDSRNCQHIWDLYWLLLWYMQSILRKLQCIFCMIARLLTSCDGDGAEKGLCYGLYGMPGALFTFKTRSPARSIIKIANSTLSAYKQALTSSSRSTQHRHLSLVSPTWGLVQYHHRHSFHANIYGVWSCLP